jgi:hypothetical protein
MGDPSLPTPLAPVEAPFVWVAATGLFVALSFAPLLAVFNHPDGRRKWRELHGRLPWAVSDRGLLPFVAINVAFLLLAAGSYWACRGGHKFQHRMFPAITFYATMAVFALWSLPAAFGHRHLPTAVHVVAFGGFVTYAVAVFLSGSWIAGGVACGGVVALLAITAAWWFDEPVVIVAPAEPSFVFRV